MKVFHYCAEVLKDTPLFEACNTRELLANDREGAIYNDFDSTPGHLIKDSDFSTEDLQSSHQVIIIIIHNKNSSLQN